MSEPLTRSRGRPPKPAAERRRNNQVVRLRDATLEAVRSAASGNQRSLSEELEFRVEESFQSDRLLEIMLGIGSLARLFKGLKEVIDKVKEISECQDVKPSDQEIAFETGKALRLVVSKHFPDGENIPSSPAEANNNIRNRKAGDIAALAAWYWFMFSDAERREEDRPPRRPATPLKKIMGR